MGRRDFKFIVIGTGVAGRTAAMMAAEAGIKTAMVGFKNKPGSAAKARALANAKVSCYHGHARFVNPHEVVVGNRHLTADKFLIATGTELIDDRIKGLSEVAYFTPREVHKLQTPPETVVVIGGGKCGCETAQYLAGLGAKVIIIEAQKQILPKEDKEIGQFMKHCFEVRSRISVLTGERVMEVVQEKKGKKAVTYRLDGKMHTIRVNAVVLAGGTKPAIDISLEKAGVKIDRGFIKTNKSLLTSNKNIWAAGSVLGGDNSIEKSIYEAKLVTANMIKRGKAMVNYSGFTRVTETFPKIAKVGMNEKEARILKRKIRSSLVSLASMEHAQGVKIGLVKLSTDKSGMMVGATIVTPDADLVAQEVAIAVRYGLSARELASTPHVATNWGEAVKTAAKKLAKKK